LQESMPQSMAHFFSMGVPGVLLEADGRVFHNAGATEAQELGTMLASAVSYLRMFEKARQPLVYAAPHIGFALSVDQDQLLSMAKVRALRRLWARIQEVCSIPASTASIHAETSYRMMTTADPETNILRTAIACFAPAAG
ncbi:MAG: methylmalonyl-CoA mutase, partial [Mesorhizobium sp.]